MSKKESKTTFSKRDLVSDDVRQLDAKLTELFQIKDGSGRAVGTGYGVYAFYDYDGEPIYIGQTYEKLSSRVRRHLTNRRTDAVAMSVLDPFEVAKVELWVLTYDKPKDRTPEMSTFREHLNQLEYTVASQLVERSSFNAILNEQDIKPSEVVELPESYSLDIVPPELRRQREHPDVRIARRASTIARLAQIISERSVSKGLRRTLVTQARRLENLATARYEQIPGAVETKSEPDE